MLPYDFGFDSGKDADYDWGDEDVDGNDVDGNDGDGNDVDGNDGDGNDVDGNDVDGNDGDGNDEDGNDVDGNDGDGNDEDGNDEDGDMVVISSGDMKCIPTQWLPIFKVITKISKEYGDKYKYNEMTIKEVADLIGPGDNDTANPAVGKWQFIDLLKQAKSAGLKETDYFNNCNQDKMAMDLVKNKRKISLELIKNNPVEAGLRFAKEWAGLPVLEDVTDTNGHHKKGKSYYESKKNHAYATVDEVRDAFNKMVNNVLVNCGLTQDEEKLYNDNIKDNSDAYDFRWWVHQNNERLKKVNDGLKKCDHDDGLDIDKGGKNPYTEIAFKLVGKKWVDEGKPKKPNVVSDSVVRSGLPKANFDKIPNSTNYRSGQLTLSELKYVIENYGIKNIVRMNGDSGSGDPTDGKSKSNGEEVLRSEEKELAESLGVNYQTIFAHQGYVDRTGGQVGKYLLDNGYGDEQKIWDYTIKYNNWCGMNNFIKSGYRKYAETFVPDITEEEYEELCGDYKNKEKYDEKIPQTDKIQILVIGDSQSAGGNSYHTKLNKDKYNVTNTAKSGKNTEWMLEKLKDQNLNKYNIIIIMGGGNDDWREVTDKTAQNNLDKMYNYVKNNSDATLIAISNPTKKYYTEITGTERPANTAIANHTMNSDIPDYKIDSNKLNKTYFSPKKYYHLNDDGQEWVYKQLKSILDKL
jgi:lysophospholipase L1-like esterase